MKVHNGAIFDSNDGSVTYAALWDDQIRIAKATVGYLDWFLGSAYAPRFCLAALFKIYYESGGFCHKNPSQVVFNGLDIPLPIY